MLYLGQRTAAKCNLTDQRNDFGDHLLSQCRLLQSTFLDYGGGSDVAHVIENNAAINCDCIIKLSVEKTIKTNFRLQQQQQNEL